jgi:hypothetical protein
MNTKIVLAWTEDTQEIAPGQATWRHDLGERPRFIDAMKAHAAMWTNEGTDEDLGKASAYAKKEYPNCGRLLLPGVRARSAVPRPQGDSFRRRRRR